MIRGCTMWRRQHHDRRILPLGARALQRSKAPPRHSRLGAREGSEIEHLGRELMRQAGDTAGSQYGFRRRDAPSADLCARISAVGSVTPRGTCFGSSYLVHGTRLTAAIGASRSMPDDLAKVP